jgi:hypothetical protein
MRTLASILAAAVLVATGAPGGALAQQAPAGQGIGVVTALQGQATVGRVAFPQPAPLKFKDEVFFRDQITTKEKSTVRVLLGGKGSLTIREQSQVTLDESVGPDGGRRSIIGVLSGKVAAAIARALMGQGEAVEVRTPNAVAAVRGTVLIAEYVPPPVSAAAPTPILLASADPRGLLAQAPGTPGGQSNFLVLSGNVTVTPQGQPPVNLGPMQSLSIVITPQGAQVGPVQNVTPAQAAQAAQGLQSGKSHTGEAESGRNSQAQAQVAATVANAVVDAITGGPGSTPPVKGPENLPGGGPQNPSQTDPPPPLPPTIVTTENILPAGPLVNIGGPIEVPAGVPIATFDGGPPNTVTAVSELPSPWEGPLLAPTGTTITHTGPIVSAPSLTASGSTPLLQVSGTQFTNAGPLIESGGSVETSAPIIGVSPGASASIGGLVAPGAGVTGIYASLGPNPAAVVEGNLSSGTLFSLGNGSLSASGPLLAIQPGGNAFVGGLASLDDGSMSLSGTAVSVVNGGLASSGPLFSLANGSSLEGSSAPIVSVDPSAVALGGPVLSLSGGSWASIGGSVLSAVDSIVTATGLVSVTGAGSTFTLSGKAPLLDVQGGVLILNGSVLAAADWGTASLGGPVVRMGPSESGNSGLDLRAPIVSVGENSSVTLTGPVLEVADGLVTDGGRGQGLAWVYNGSLLLADSVLKSQNSDLYFSGPMVALEESWESIHSPGSQAMLSLSGGSLTLSGTGGLLAVDNGYVQLGGPLLEATGTAIVSTGGSPLIVVRNYSELYSSGPHLVGVSGGSLALASPLLGIFDDASAWLDGPLLRVSNGRVTGTTASAGLVSIQTGNLDSNGILDSTNSSLSFAGAMASVQGRSYNGVSSSTAGVPLFGISGGSLALQGAGALVRMSGGSISGSGGFLAADTVTIDASTASGPLVQMAGGSYAYTGESSSLFTLSGGSLSAPGLVAADTGSRLVLSGGSPSQGSLLDATGTPLTFSGAVVRMQDSPQGLYASVADAALLNMHGGSLSLGSSGSLLALDGSQLTLFGPILHAGSGTVATATAGPGALLNLTNGSTLSTVESLVKIGGGTSLTTGRTVLESMGSSITVNGPLFLIGGSTPGAETRMTATGGPLVKLTDSTLTSNGIGWSDGTGSLITLPATMLDATGSTIAFDAGPDSPETDLDVITHLSAPGVAQIRLTDSQYTDYSPDNQMLELPRTGTFDGLLLQATGGTINLPGSNLLGVWGGAEVTTTATTALIQLNGTSVQTGLDALVVSSGELTMSGPLLQATGGSEITTAGASSLLSVNGGGRLIGTGAGPLLDLSQTLVNVGSSVVSVVIPGSSIDLSGPLVSISEASEIHSPGNFLLLQYGSSIASRTSQPLIRISDSTLNTSWDVIEVGEGSTLRLGSAGFESTPPSGGPLLIADGATISSQGSLLTLVGTGMFGPSTLEAWGSQPLLQFVGGSVTTGGALVSVMDGSSLSMAGGLVRGTGTDVDVNGSLLQLSGYFDGTVYQGSALTTSGTQPLLQFVGGMSSTTGTAVQLTGESRLDAGGALIGLGGGPTTTTLVTPQLLDSQDSSVSLAGSLLALGGNATVIRGDGYGPLVNISCASCDAFGRGMGAPGTLYADAIFTSVGVGNSLAITGPLLDATNAEISLNAFSRVASGSLAVTYDLDSWTPLVRVSDSTLTLWEVGAALIEPLADVDGDVRGLGLQAQSSILGSELILAGPLLRLRSVNLRDASESSAYVQLTDTIVDNVGSGSPVIEVLGTATTAGRLFRATYTDVYADTNLFSVAPGATLVSAATGQLIEIDNSNVYAGSDVLSVRGQVSLDGPLLKSGSGVSSSFDSPGAGASLLAVTNGGRIAQVSTSGLPVIEMYSTAADLLGSLVRVDGAGSTISTDAGVAAVSGNSYISLGGSLLTVANGGSVNGTGTGPLIHLDDTWGGVDTGGSLVSVTGTGSSVTTGGTLFLASMSENITPGAGLLGVSGGGSVTGSGSTALLQVLGSSLDAAGHLVRVDGGAISAAGGLLEANGATLSVGGLLEVKGSGSVIGTGTGPLIRVANSGITYTPSVLPGPKALLSVEGGASLVSGGSLFSAETATFGGTLPDALVAVKNGSLKVSPSSLGYGGFAGALLDLRNTTLALDDEGDRRPLAILASSTLETTSGPILTLRNAGGLTVSSLLQFEGAGNILKLRGTLLDLGDSTLWLESIGREMEGASLNEAASFHLMAADEPLIRMQNSALHLLEAGAPLIDPGFGPSANVTGLGLISQGGTINLAGPLLVLNSVNLVHPTNATPYLQLDGTAVDLTTASLTALIAVPGNESSTTGPLLRATNGTFALTGALLLGMDNGGKLTGTGTDPLLQFQGGSVTTSQPLLGLRGGASLVLAGPLLSTQGTSFTISDGVLGLGDDSGPVTSANLKSTSADSLLQLSGGSVAIGSNGQVVGLTAGSTIELAGPLLRIADGAMVALEGPVLGLTMDSRVRSTSSLPLITLAGSAANLDPVYGLGQDMPVTGGYGGFLTAPLVAVEGAAPNLANPHIDLPGTVGTPGGALVRVDTALLQASVPIVQALNAAINLKSNPGLTGSGALEVYRSNVTVNAPAAVWLDNSFLQIHNGPLLSLTGGTQMNVSGDFTHLTGGARLVVANGPLIYVDGPSTQLNVGGSLAHFGTSSGNQLIVNSPVAVNATISGVGVNQGAAGQITIGPNPVTVGPSRTPGWGGNIVNLTGAVIQTTNGGRVNITAPAN